MLYPPSLNSTSSAFVFNGNSYQINYTMPTYQDIKQITQIDIKVVRQVDNKNLVNKTHYADGIIHTPTFTFNTVTILKEDLITWEPGTLYKIQLRFCNALEQSEWSNIMITKSISDLKLNVWPGEHNTLRPKFYGQCEASEEAEQEYSFALISAEDKLIEASPWLNHIAEMDAYRFKQQLENKKKYYIQYSVKTVNNYISTYLYTYTAQEFYLNKLNDIKFMVDADNENGCIKCSIDTFNAAGEAVALTGNYIIARTDERSNYTLWEDLKLQAWHNKNFKNEVIFIDNTIEHGIKYKYSLAYENDELNRTQALLANNGNAISCNFEYGFIGCGNVQLRLAFNHETSSFKRTRAENKQDVLGAQYPVFMRNSVINYADFNISATISLLMDEYNYFFEKRDNGYYYQNNLILTTKELVGTSPSELNYLLERLFREKVLEFLQDGQPKLYRSPSAGNLIVRLLNVSCTPNKTLNNLIYNISANVYEIASFSIDNLKSMNILDVGNHATIELRNAGSAIAATITKDTFIKYNTNDIYTCLKEQEKHLIAGANYQIVVSHLDYIRFETQNSNIVAATITSLDNPQGITVYINPNRWYDLSGMNCNTITSITITKTDDIMINCIYTLSVEKIKVKELVTSDIRADFGQLLVISADDLIPNIIQAVKNMVKVDNELIEFGDEPDSENKYWNHNGTYSFQFGLITALSIEAEPGSKIQITIGDALMDYIIGPTGYYSLTNIDEPITSLKVTADNALVNYEASYLLNKYSEGAS